MHRLMPEAFVAAGVLPAHFAVGNSTNTFVLDLRRHYDRGIACFLLEWNRSMRKRLQVHGCGRSLRMQHKLVPMAQHEIQEYMNFFRTNGNISALILAKIFCSRF